MRRQQRDSVDRGSQDNLFFRECLGALSRRLYLEQELMLVGFLLLSMGCRCLSISGGRPPSSSEKTKADVQVAAYYFPLWHMQPEDKLFPHLHNPSKQDTSAVFGEWKSIKAAIPRFEGHAQPKVPLWGYGDEADPRVMAQKIDAAADHGIDAFIFDWYYYPSGPYQGTYLESALNNGYLQARNNKRVKFALMWANHDLGDSPGAIDREHFDAIIDHVVKDYFTHPSYWKINGKPYFSVYEVGTLIRGLGGPDGTREALAAFEAQAREAGLAGVHFNAIESQIRSHPPYEVGILREIGFDSATSYIWTHLVGFRDRPATDYEFFRENYFLVYDREKNNYGIPYFPNVTMGWDPTPRLQPGQPYDASGPYPNDPIISNNTPERFKRALEQARQRALWLPEGQRVITVNAWNEWGEGSYLEPDTLTGMAYLEAIREVFKPSW